MTTAFDPNDHIITLKGKAYIEVKWRLVWLRAEHPDASIVTQMLRYDEREAVYVATITIPGGGTATGHGSEKPADFGDYCEKAETKAIGRALGALGYGTQFAEDFDMGAGETQRVVDSPVQRPTPRPATRAAAGDNVAPPVRTSDDPQGPAPADQIAALRTAIATAGWPVDKVRAVLQGDWQVTKLSQLTVSQANRLLDWLEGEIAERRRSTQ